jgi:purine-binding chemotaxis protein CheW
MADKIISNLHSYLTFQLAGEHFAVNVGNVIKIQELVDITSIPNAPIYMKGVINLHGNVVPVIDARTKFGFISKEYDSLTSIIVINAHIEDDYVDIGMIVDAAQNVVEFQSTDIKESPSIGNKFRTDFIKGVAQLESKFVMILDIDKIFSSSEMLSIQSSSNVSQNHTES